MENELLLESLDPEKTYLIETEDNSFVLHLSKGVFYTKKEASKDPRYCLVTKINGKKTYKERDLELGSELEYYHPKLNREVSSGIVTSISIR